MFRLFISWHINHAEDQGRKEQERYGTQDNESGCRKEAKDVNGNEK